MNIILEGTCRFCRCTDERACPGGCWWIDERHTVCNRCAHRRLEGLVEVRGRTLRFAGEDVMAAIGLEQDDLVAALESAFPGARVEVLTELEP